MPQSIVSLFRVVIGSSAYRLFSVFASVLLAESTAFAQARSVPYLDPTLPAEERIADLLPRMSLEEKVALLGGGGGGFETKSNARLQIPSLTMTDGPVGVRWGASTAFPSSILMAATWDTSLVRLLGAALGREARAKGRTVLLGPCVNIQRVPQGGRNFESFGEDPFLAARMAVAYIKGVQSERVAATIKHFAANNQEYERTTINAVVDERALREIYLPAFRASVEEAGVWAVMNAYNRLNGPYCTEQSHLNNDILKREWKFKGILMSDWGATHSTVETANGGLDLEMPFGEHFGAELLKAVNDGRVAQSVIDDKVARILRILILSGTFDAHGRSDSASVDLNGHARLNREVAQSGIVLLKNDRELLPLKREALCRIAVIGPNASTLRFGGGGSALVHPTYTVSPLEALRSRAGAGVSIEYAQGCSMLGDIAPIDSMLLSPPDAPAVLHGMRGEYFDNAELRGSPIMVRNDGQISFEWGQGSPAPGIKPDNFSVRWTGTFTPRASDAYTFATVSDDGVRLFVDGSLVIDDWNDHAVYTNRARVELKKGVAHQIRLEYYEHGGDAVVKFGLSLTDERLLEPARSLAQRSDLVIICAGLSHDEESEGFDRKTLELPANQVRLIQEVAMVNRDVVVVLNAGAPVLMDGWIGAVPALVQSWYPGQEGGNAVADVLFGDVSPSGKLPCTYPKRWEDCSAYPTYPGADGVTEYRDGLFVGYRYFDRQNLQPLFPFGHGLSYTIFQYDSLVVERRQGIPNPIVQVSFVVTNAGHRDGAEVAQVYVAEENPLVERPPKELKAFSKEYLKAGQGTSVRCLLRRDAFAHYDVSKRAWVVNRGKYRILVGSSSRDIRLAGSTSF